MIRLLFVFSLIASNLFAQTDTIQVFYEIGRYELSTEELKKLDIDQNSWQNVDIISYTDYLGSTDLNNKLSTNRSREIRARLVQRGLDTELLGIVEGRGIIGEILDSKIGIQKNRRTDIVVSRVTRSEIVENISDVKIESPDDTVQKVELKSQIESAKIGDHLVLSDMNFLPGQHYLTEESKTAYDELFQLLKNNPSLRIVIEGHICCKIDDEDGFDLATNLYNLSEARAQYVYEILIEDGISANRLSFKGFARNKPIFPNEQTEEEKQANRRVEIRIIEK